MDINENLVQFQGKFIIPEVPNVERYLLVSGEFQIGDVIHKPNEDGTYDFIYKVSPIRIVVDSGDKKLVGKVKKRSSQRLRGAIWHEYQKTDQPEEFFEDYYELFVNKLIAHLPEVKDFLAN